MVRKENLVVKHEIRGGTGDVYMYHILEENELMGHGTLYARVVLPPGSSIGYHRHVGNTEPYYILKGSGIFVDEKGERVPVQAGDVCVIACGESHGMENTGKEDLEIMALIINEG
ncbi:MAG: cupin domain-containing protein [Lachnospiraceae bacterium]|jgi:mannose-6-phosphate isomerase-like protein (cupin superfamily)|nr:cupin domain-containing protein [Lachnospiraceae bacterium]